MKPWMYSDFAGEKTRVGIWDAIGNCIPFSYWFAPADEYVEARFGHLKYKDVDVFAIQACAFE